MNEITVLGTRRIAVATTSTILAEARLLRDQVEAVRAHRSGSSTLRDMEAYANNIVTDALALEHGLAHRGIWVARLGWELGKANMLAERCGGRGVSLGLRDIWRGWADATRRLMRQLERLSGTD